MAGGRYPRRRKSELADILQRGNRNDDALGEEEGNSVQEGVWKGIQEESLYDPRDLVNSAGGIRGGASSRARIIILLCVAFVVSFVERICSLEFFAVVELGSFKTRAKSTPHDAIRAQATNRPKQGLWNPIAPSE